MQTKDLRSTPGEDARHESGARSASELWTNRGRLGFLQESAVSLVSSRVITEKQKAPQRPFQGNSEEHPKHKMKRLLLLV